MTNEQIEKFVANEYLDKSPVEIKFKTRTAITGTFIKMQDFGELKSKNLWRIVNQSSIEAFKKSRDINFSRIFSGSEITKLSASKN